MRKYMWPGACLPSATVLINAAHTGSQGRLTVDRIENHAARTSFHFPFKHLTNVVCDLLQTIPVPYELGTAV